MPLKRRYRRRTRRPLYRARTYRRKGYVARRSGRLARYVKKVARSTQETKFITYAAAASLNQNQWRVWNLIRDPAQGPGQNQVLGEQFFVKGFRIRLQISTFGGTTTAANPTEFMVALIWAKDELTTTTTGGFAVADFQVASSGIITLDRYNTDNIKVIKSWRFRITPAFSGQAIDKCLRTFVPINRNYRMESSISPYGKYGAYYLIAGFYNPGATTGTTTIQCAWNTTTYFKDA